MFFDNALRLKKRRRTGTLVSPRRAAPTLGLYFVSYVHLYFATHDVVRCILILVINNPSFPHSYLCSTPFARRERLSPGTLPDGIWLLPTLSIVSMPSHSQLPTFSFHHSKNKAAYGQADPSPDSGPSLVLLCHSLSTLSPRPFSGSIR